MDAGAENERLGALRSSFIFTMEVFIMEMQLFRKEVRFTDVPASNLRWLNLEGRASNYNIKGSRNFELELPEDYARDLADLGWRVKKNGYDPDKDKFVNTDDLPQVLWPEAENA